MAWRSKQLRRRSRTYPRRGSSTQVADRDICLGLSILGIRAAHTSLRIVSTARFCVSEDHLGLSSPARVSSWHAETGDEKEPPGAIYHRSVVRRDVHEGHGCVCLALRILGH